MFTSADPGLVGGSTLHGKAIPSSQDSIPQPGSAGPRDLISFGSATSIASAQLMVS
jgi:hypothetical protein